MRTSTPVIALSLGRYVRGAGRSQRTDMRDVGAEQMPSGRRCPNVELDPKGSPRMYVGQWDEHQ